MLNPFNPQQDSELRGFFSALRLQSRLLNHIQSTKVDDQIFQVIQNAFDEALKKEHLVILPDVAKKFLLAQVMRKVLGDMLGRLDDRGRIRSL